MIIGEFLYNSLENVASSTAIARRRLAAWGGLFLCTAGALITYAETSRLEPHTIAGAAGAALFAGSSYVCFDGYMFGRSQTDQQPIMELAPVVAEASPAPENLDV